MWYPENCVICGGINHEINALGPSLNAKSTETLVSDPFLGESSIFSFFWGIKEMGSPAWMSRVGKNSEQHWLKGLQMIQFECPRHWNSSVSSILGVGKFSQLPILALWGNKNWLPSMKVRSWKNFWTKLAKRSAIGPVWMPQALNPLFITRVSFVFVAASMIRI